MGKRVLLIEDEPNIIEALSFILSRDGWTVHIHEDGATAADKVRSYPPDMIILDVMLPGCSGFEILRELREDDATKSIPIMMLTARGQDKDRDLALRLGADHYMTKPFSNTEVRDQVRDLINA
jgi:DNA-binding response OmpR family regulator